MSDKIVPQSREPSIRSTLLPLLTSAEGETPVKTLSLIFVAICTVVFVHTSAAQTVVVGRCRPHQVSYSTISAAVAAVTPNSTVLVCPGTYAESVTITTPLTLKGLTSVAGTRTAFVQDITVQETGPVDISNIVVNGNGVTLNGISYVTATGTVENVDVRGGGIVARGAGVNAGSSLNVRNSSISGGNIYATGTVSAGSVLNLTSNWITTTIDYENGANGLIEQNSILGGGLLMDYYFGSVTVNGNTIVGANVGISFGSTESPIVITNNRFYNNGTAILSGQREGGATINSNTIVQSSTAAISFTFCNDGLANTYEHNTIVDAPVGIANESTQDVIAGNIFYNVPTTSTACP
jgi:hypothetical protein